VPGQPRATLAASFPARAVRRRFLAEGLTLAALGGLAGTAGGIAYAWLMLVALRTQRPDEYQSFMITHGPEGSSVRPVRSNRLPAPTHMTVPEADYEPALEDTQPRRTLAQHLFGHREPRPGSTSTVARFGQAEAAAAGRRDLDLVGLKGVEFDRRGQRF